MREPHDGDLKEIKADIVRARQFARTHFNEYKDEQTTPSHLLAPPTFALEFPDPVTMVVAVVSYGSIVSVSMATYKLVWDESDKPSWRGRFILGARSLGDLHVPDTLEGLSRPHYDQEAAFAAIGL